MKREREREIVLDGMGDGKCFSSWGNSSKRVVMAFSGREQENKRKRKRASRGTCACRICNELQWKAYKTQINRPIIVLGWSPDGRVEMTGGQLWGLIDGWICAPGAIIFCCTMCVCVIGSKNWMGDNILSCVIICLRLSMNYKSKMGFSSIFI